ncbi:MAG: hypothetical protein D6B25_18060 [Desulfobulbaceae bacterium]|nr:MAG: hypothetical protein D6B25_18060 [Desulfobulbaceae bacterium]
MTNILRSLITDIPLRIYRLYEDRFKSMLMENPMENHFYQNIDSIKRYNIVCFPDFLSTSFSSNEERASYV